jgi:hypothetical protein
VISTPESDILKETQRILDTAEKKDIVLRLFGGMAVRFRCPSATHRSLERKYADIDMMGLKKQSKQIKTLFQQDLGYVPREIFNALQGDKRLIFNDLENERRIDIFLDVFEMCHRFDFKDRLTKDKATLPLADLLATKLQVVEITEREYRDIIALVHDHDISDTDSADSINGAYLARLTGDDWGIYKTFSVNIANILSAVSRYNLEAKDEELVRKRLDGLQNRFENAPKTMRWKLRARVGEKAKWYELPEQDKKVVDSRVTKTE